MMTQDCDKEQSKINQTTLRAPVCIKTKNQRYNLISINILLEMMSVNIFPHIFRLHTYCTPPCLIIVFVVFSFFLSHASGHGVWDLSSSARFEPMPAILEVQRLNHWTTREVPVVFSIERI